MEDLEEIRKRLKTKKQQPKLTDKSFGRLYHFAITTMSIVAIALFCGCFVKTNPNLDIVSYIDTHILSLLPNISLERFEPVSQTIQYQVLGENLYKNNDEFIYAFDEGMVVDVGEGKLTILYQNGISATYNNLASVSVKELDHIILNEKLGTYENHFQMILTKDGAIVKYEDIFA